jgi:hypothetical protein
VRAPAERDLIQSLLRHGARFLEPQPKIVAAADWLADLGLVELRRALLVQCANPADSDFPPLLRDCDGLIELRENVDEGGGDYHCPTCGRHVYPEAAGKQQLESLCVQVRQKGIEAFLIHRLGELAAGRSFSGGVLTVSLQNLNGFVCLVGYCTDERWYGRTRAASQACVYVVVGPDKGTQMMAEEAVALVELVDILLGAKDLRSLLVERAAMGPAAVTNVDVPIYGLGTRPISLAPKTHPEQHRIFNICLSKEGLFVDGLLAIRVQRRATALAIMQVLMRTYAEAAVSGRTVEPMTADTLADAVEPFIGAVEDADNIARNIRRIRKSIVDTVRQHSGKPIGEHDIIETVSRSGADEGAEGYRLNPRRVALGPLEP